MALRYCVLASGSSGNCLWVQGGGVELLVDCGIAVRTAAAHLSTVDSRVEEIQAVVCTHGHGDHVGNVAALSRKSGAALYGTQRTLDDIPFEPAAELLRPLRQRSCVQLGGLTIRTAATPHDAPGSVCVVVTDGERSVGLCTDLGRSTLAVETHLAGLDGLVIELNHDWDMLRDGPYPPHLKRRIASDLGHLSNDQGAELLGRLAHAGLQHVTLAHLSEHNNTPELARAAAERALAAAGVHPVLAIGAQRKPGAVVTLGPSRRQGQLKLPLG